MLKIGKKYVIVGFVKGKNELRELIKNLAKQEEEEWSPENVGDNFMCKACELGKVVINRCREQNYNISISKLHKLLILMHGEYLAKYQKPLFPENVICWGCGVAIKEVEIEFLPYDFSSDEYLPEYIAVLNSEKEIINNVLEQFGNLDIFEIKADPRLMELVTKYPYIEGSKTIIPNEEIQRVFVSYGQSKC